MYNCVRAVQALHIMLQGCVELLGVGANMGRQDNIAEEGGRAVAVVAQGASVAKEMGDVRWASSALLYCTKLISVAEEMGEVRWGLSWVVLLRELSQQQRHVLSCLKAHCVA